MKKAKWHNLFNLVSADYNSLNHSLFFIFDPQKLKKEKLVLTVWYFSFRVWNTIYQYDSKGILVEEFSRNLDQVSRVKHFWLERDYYYLYHLSHE